MINYSIVNAENGQQFVTGFVSGKIVTADDTHPNFNSIKAAIALDMDDPGSVDPQQFMDFFDIPATIERAFERLSQRVTIQHGKVLFDGDPAQPGLSGQILRFLDEGLDVKPLVAFMENVMANPQPESREQAWEWFNNHDFAITDDGRVAAFKGVNSDHKGGYQSGFSGDAHVLTAAGEDIDYVGVRIPYAVGDTVTMPRSAVDFDPRSSCSTGLHVGTQDYARGYANAGCMMRVLVDPRDVVSVPANGAGAKIRVCRFVIDAISDDADASALYRPAAARFAVGDVIVDVDGDMATIVEGPDCVGNFRVEFENEDYSKMSLAPEEMARVA